MHAEIDKIADVTYIHVNLKLKKLLTIKSNIQIKFGLHYYFSYDKIFKTRSHLTIFARYFLKLFFNTK